MRVLAISLLAFSTLLTSCCEINNEGVGALAGGAVGGILGNQIGGGSGKVIATTGGAVIGALLGSSIGRSMDKVDRMQLEKVLETSPTGRAVGWQNPDSGNRYTVQPLRTYYRNDEEPCREYVTKAIIGGKVQQIYGKACRQSDGSWKVAE